MKRLHYIYVGIGLIFSLIGVRAPTLYGAEKVDIEAARIHVGAARLQLADGDLAGARDNLLKAAQLRPDHPGTVATLAIVQSQLQDRSAVLGSLETLVQMGADYSVALAGELGALSTDPEVLALLADMKDNAAPTSRSTEGFTLGRAGFFPEAVAWDGVGARWYVGDMRSGEILQVAPGGEVVPVDPTGQTGRLAVSGLLVDSQRRALYVATVGEKVRAGLPEGEVGRAALLVYDLADLSRPPRRLEPPGEGPHHLSEMALAPDGLVALSDGKAGALYLLRPGAAELAVLVPPRALMAPQGLAFTRGGKRLYVADYAMGLRRVDLETGQTHAVADSGALTLLGIDGLVSWEGRLVAIQNGTSPQRVISVELDRRGREIKRVRVLEVSHPRWGEPTTGVVVDDALVYVANAPWAQVGEEGLRADAVLPAPLYLRLPLTE